MQQSKVFSTGQDFGVAGGSHLFVIWISTHRLSRHACRKETVKRRHLQLRYIPCILVVGSCALIRVYLLASLELFLGHYVK